MVLFVFKIFCMKINTLMHTFWTKFKKLVATPVEVSSLFQGPKNVDLSIYFWSEEIIGCSTRSVGRMTHQTAFWMLKNVLIWACLLQLVSLIFSITSSNQMLGHLSELAVLSYSNGTAATSPVILKNQAMIEVLSRRPTFFGFGFVLKDCLDSSSYALIHYSSPATIL